MFKWCQHSAVCYAYLEDVPSHKLELDKNCFQKSRWFTRGCTLQELIALKDVVFHSQDWIRYETKRDLASVLAEVTNVDEVVLIDSSKLSHASIARRLSWAANRETSREEDSAYCLLGICGINMPLRYGEGSGAFIRLQEEIMRISTDQSILAGVIRQ